MTFVAQSSTRVLAFSSRELNHFGAPSLITRNTNDVQQVQMLVLLSSTMFVAAPITMIGGIIMALRTDPGLSWLVAVAMPVLAFSIFLIIRQMSPLFRVIQSRIDVVNRILREQITGIRVVRAFVREPYETARFARANAELTDTTTSVGRYAASIFPIVMFILNVSSVAVLWFGARRIDAGEMQIGALTAFLTYLIQILMSVMMATFLLIIAPRAAVCAERIEEVLGTESSVVPPLHPVTELSATGLVAFRDTDFTYPGAASPVLRNITFTAEPGQTTAIIGSTGAGKSTLISLIPRLFDATGRVGHGGRGRGTRLRPRTALEPDRAGAAEGVPVHRHRRQQPAIRQPGRHRRGALAGAAGGSGRGLRTRNARTSRGAYLPGWHQCFRRAAAASCDRAGTGQASGDLCFR